MHRASVLLFATGAPKPEEQIKVPGNLKYSQALKNFRLPKKNILTIRTEYDIINAVSQDVLLAKLKKRKKV